MSDEKMWIWRSALNVLETSLYAQHVHMLFSELKLVSIIIINPDSIQSQRMVAFYFEVHV